MFFQDGHTYATEALLPDMGSIELVSVDELNVGIRHYQGKETDFSKLPKYADLKAGSDCIFTDSGKYAVYSEERDKWIII